MGMSWGGCPYFFALFTIALECTHFIQTQIYFSKYHIFYLIFNYKAFTLAEV
jgi:hypothetical protein